MTVVANLKQSIARQISELLGVSVEAEWIEFANPKAGSQLALPCFRFSKDLQSAPQEIATRIAAAVQLPEIERIEAEGPYVNFWIAPNSLLAGLQDNQKYLQDATANGKTAIIEFLSPNLAKPLSIGHLRNALQGRAATRMYANAGYRVITDNHIGDWGTVFGMWVVGFEKFSSDEQLEHDGVEELGRVYVEMRKALKHEAEQGESQLADEVQDWLLRLEQGDSEATAYHERFSAISLKSIEQQMADFGIQFDYNLGESFYIERGKVMVNDLIASGQAIKNPDDSVIIPLDEEGLETPMLIEKANGAALYSTSDIATIAYREETWNPDIVVYVVGMEQQFHFTQLFAANKKVGWSDAELVHHWYGLIEELAEDGTRQKMSSRSKAVYMSDLIALAIERAHEIAPDGLSDDDIKKIALGALTFQEFSAAHTGNTLFDWDAMFSLSGFSGPYVQYAAVRINSILAKAEMVPTHPPENYDWSPYAELLWVLNKYPVVIDEATELREYHKLATYVYELARAWNRFYENVPILDSAGDERLARLWLATTIGAYIERSLYLLGISVPAKM